MIMKKLVDDSDVIYHLAAAVGVKSILDNPLKGIRRIGNLRCVSLKLNYSISKKFLVYIFYFLKIFSIDSI